MPVPVPYALASSLLLRDAAALLAAELPAELAATQAVLNNGGPTTIVLPVPADLRRAYWPQTRDRLPQVALHVTDRRTSLVDSANQDSMESVLEVRVVVGDGDLGTLDESGFSDAMMSYLGTVSGLLQRRLPQVACATSAVHTVTERRAVWDPQVDTVAGTWIQAGRLELVVMQTVIFTRPFAPSPLLTDLDLALTTDLDVVVTT